MDEIELDRLLAKTYWDAHAKGRESAAELSAERIQRLEQKVAELQSAREEPARRYTTASGYQLVEVNGYAYGWRGGPELEVGELVDLPANYVSPKGWRGKVSCLGTLWEGEPAYVLRRVINKAATSTG